MTRNDPGTMTTNALVQEDHTAIDRRWIYAVPVLIIVLDQILKRIVSGWIGPGADVHRWELLGSAVAFEYVENRGAAFGILPEQTEVLTAVSIAISIFAVVVMHRELEHHPLSSLAIGMIVGGAVGNIIDRIWHGFVVDFVAVGAWPRFNLADSMITIGIVLLLVSSIRDERSEQRKQASEEAG